VPGWKSFPSSELFNRPARQEHIGHGSRDDTHVVDVANVTDGKSASEVRGESTAAAQPAEQPPVEPAMASPQQKVWVMPKPRVTRTQADKLGRVAVEATASIARAVAAVARFAARTVTRLSRAIEAVPRALLLFVIAGLLLLFGLAGAIALQNSLGLICTVVVIPVCSILLGALGQRWYSRLAGRPAAHPVTSAEPAPSELQRSVEYVDQKLAVALTTFGTERHQQAVIALFQAKTAVELTLGTEKAAVDHRLEVPLLDDQGSRPRIRAGSASKTLLRESNSLAAS
jgi:hypothetical protein